MRRLGLVLFAFAVLGLAPVAHAASITLDLNCTIGHGNACTPHSPYGTITLTDHGNSVDVSVTLADRHDDILGVYLNYDATHHQINHGFDFAVTNGTVVDYGQNSEGPHSYSGLDLSLNPSGTPGSWTGTISLRDCTRSHNGSCTAWAYQALNASMFDLTDANGLGAVVSFDDNGNSDQNVIAGSTEAAPVPEPASMTLLGTGLIGLAGAVRRRMKK